MSQLLPYKDLQLCNASLEQILATPDDAETGYIVELDIEFPKEVHEKLIQFPPCPENIAPPREWMSEFQNKLADKLKIKQGKCTKLTPHFYKHEKYVIHYRNLKYIKELGVELGTVYNVVSFKQSRWLEGYIKKIPS